MAKYKCGNRECNDEELDLLEAIRKGEKKVGEPGAALPDIQGIGNQLANVCESFPGLCGKVDAIADTVKEMQEEKHSHPVPDDNLVEVLVQADEDCSECKGKVKEGLLPKLAARFGYTLTPVPAPAPESEEPAEAAEPEPAAKEPPADQKQPAAEAAEPEAAAAPEAAEEPPAPDQEETEESGGEDEGEGFAFLPKAG